MPLPDRSLHPEFFECKGGAEECKEGGKEEGTPSPKDEV